MKHYFVKGQNGNWFNEKTGYYLGTSGTLYADMIAEEEWTVEEAIEQLMNAVNESLVED